MELIIEDSELSSGNLPLIEYALTALWEEQHDRLITHTAYYKVGRVSGALSKRADEMISGLSKEEKKIAERVFIKLVSIREGSCDTRIVARREAYEDDEWELVLKLSSQQQRLLVVDNQGEAASPTVEIVHETLITRWGQFQSWLKKNRKLLSWRSELRPQKKTWLDNKENADNLLLGDALIVASRWKNEEEDKLEPAEREFIQSSIDYAAAQNVKRNRRIKIFIGGSVSAGLFFIALSSVLYSLLTETQRQKKEIQTQKEIVVKERNRAQVNERRFLAKEAREILAKGDTRLAALLALESLPHDIEPNPKYDYEHYSLETLRKINGSYIETKRI